LGACAVLSEVSGAPHGNNAHLAWSFSKRTIPTYALMNMYWPNFVTLNETKVALKVITKQHPSDM
jgi:hypothetical protein